MLIVRILFALLFVAIAAALVSSAPDIARYVRMRQM